jgi:hypothetical protein
MEDQFFPLSSVFSNQRGVQEGLLSYSHFKGLPGFEDIIRLKIAHRRNYIYIYIALLSLMHSTHPPQNLPSLQLSSAETPIEPAIDDLEAIFSDCNDLALFIFSLLYSLYTDLQQGVFILIRTQEK